MDPQRRKVRRGRAKHRSYRSGPLPILYLRLLKAACDESKDCLCGSFAILASSRIHCTNRRPVANSKGGPSELSGRFSSALVCGFSVSYSPSDQGRLR